MKQRRILNDISPDFKRDTQTQEEYIARKKAQIIDFVKRYLTSSGAKGIVLGVSGGIDSFLVSALCAQACADIGRQMYIVLLPNGRQPDIDDARACAEQIKKINPNTMCDTVSIANGYAGAIKDLEGAQGFSRDPYTLGNLQPRLRMMYQYALAKGMLVAGTDHATEAVTGFYTKYGDGGSDLNPIQELVKDDIYAMAKTYGAPQAVMEKQPAAGLGISENDEAELGLRYTDICAYLKGNRIGEGAQEKLEAAYTRSMHKRAMAASLKDEYLAKEPVTHLHVGNVQEERIVKSTVKYINAHPQQVMLYAGRRAPEQPFYDGIVKTVNSPISRYNMFDTSDEEAENEMFGRLTDNFDKNVVVSGEIGPELQDIVVWLMHNGYEVTLLKDCLTRIKK